MCITAAMDEMLDYSERRMRAAISGKLPRWYLSRLRPLMDDDGIGDHAGRHPRAGDD